MALKSLRGFLPIAFWDDWKRKADGSNWYRYLLCAYHNRTTNTVHVTSHIRFELVLWEGCILAANIRRNLYRELQTSGWKNAALQSRLLVLY